MKKSLKRVLGIFVAGALTFSAFSVSALAAETASRTITVSGTGIVKVAPDTADINFTVETTEKKSDEAQTKNAKITEDVYNALKSKGILEKDIKTSGYYVYPVYNYDESSKLDKLIGYTATNRFTVTTKQIDKVGEIIDTAVKAGATSSSGISFYVEDPNKFYGDALNSAVVNASKSANSIAKALGVTLTSVVNVTESPNGNSYEVFANNKMAMDTVAEASTSASQRNTKISYDDIEIEARVTVVYGF